MVSPSKVQHQEQKQPSRENKTDRRSHARVQKGLKPLEKKSIYLDIKNHATSASLEAKIRELGGAIELFLVRSVSLVVSDRVDRTGHTNSDKRKWGCANGGSGGPPSLRSVEVPTPTPTPPTPNLSFECPLSNSTNIRGQTTQRSKSRVDAMLERALTQPQQCSVDPLDNAQNWRIPIWATDKFHTWLDKIYASFKDTNNLKQLKHKGQHSTVKDLKVKHLKGPYVKFESFHRDTRPVFLELSAWPYLNFDGDPGSCPFDTKKREKLESKVISKEIKENIQNIRTVNKEENKEMTRRPRTAARARRTEQLVAGYCEICRIDYRDLSKHVQSDQHLNFVKNDDNFLSLDKLINAGANVEAFLKLNRTKDIEKDCNLFPDGDRNLHNVVLPDEKVNKKCKDLNNFGVEEIKMVQCNGARRNLDLKLNPPHNLRTRAKHESGHLLRSKGSPWHEVEKSEKLYDKFEGFTIKKRAKGTIWIEEEDPEEKYIQEHQVKETKPEDFKVKSFSKEINEVRIISKEETLLNEKHNDSNNENIKRQEVLNSQENSRVSPECPVQKQNGTKAKDCSERNADAKCHTVQNVRSVNGITNNCINASKTEHEVLERLNCELQSGKLLSNVKKDISKDVADVVYNGHTEKNEQKDFKTPQCADNKLDEKSKCPRSNRRGGRNFRGRHRLSVEERLIEDNRAYYKVEVLGSKLRSSALSNNNGNNTVPKDTEENEKKEVSFSEKPVVVRFKRVRKSELSLLSDEAESFMFGESKRDDSSELSDGDQSSVLPRDTESSECNDSSCLLPPSSPLNSSTPMKPDPAEEDSQDSVGLGRARKRRRTHAEALIKDNADYYKFEIPGSRLRYQAPITGVKESRSPARVENPIVSEERKEADIVEKFYPSKPSPEVEKMQFSFEAVPKSEPWYQTYQRQDEGAEFWHYFSEGDTQKPFLLPYEIENFHETMMKTQARNENRKKGRGRSAGCMGRSPRKSPRCHASTLAIMSTIIRKREQQQQSSTLCTIEEYQSERSQTNTPRPDHKQENKSDVDEELKDMARTIDEMLSIKGIAELEDSFEPDNELNVHESSIPKGPPPNLLELLDNCHEIANCLENSSCASSECGEGSIESPLKRRKKRKNRTGWPGIKLKKKLHAKPPVEVDCEGENSSEKRVRMENPLTLQVTTDRLLADCNSTPNTRLNSSNPNIGLHSDKDQLISCKGNPINNPLETCTPNVPQKVYHDSVVERDKSIGTADVVSSTTLENRIETSESCNETERSFSSSKEYLYKKELSEIKEISENDPGNDENHENVYRKDVNGISISERHFIPKSKKRQRENTSSDVCEEQAEIENQDILCRKDSESGIVSRKHHNSNEMPRRRQQKGSDNADSELERHSNVVYRRNRIAKRRIYSRKGQRKNSISSNAVFEDENCKKDSYLSITCKKNVKTVKRRGETVSSEMQDSEIECALTERVSPSIISSSDLEQRRSSIEFQPVVRMMKIDDQVDMDHSILSVTVASNRRLRSSSSPRSNAQPPKKRLKTPRGQFGRWLKSS